MHNNFFYILFSISIHLRFTVLSRIWTNIPHSFTLNHSNPIEIWAINRISLLNWNYTYLHLWMRTFCFLQPIKLNHLPSMKLVCKLVPLCYVLLFKLYFVYYSYHLIYNVVVVYVILKFWVLVATHSTKSDGNVKKIQWKRFECDVFYLLLILCRWPFEYSNLEIYLLQ